MQNENKTNKSIVYFRIDKEGKNSVIYFKKEV